MTSQSCSSLETLPTASGECLGACVRNLPTGLLICFDRPSCDFQHKSLDRIKDHIKRKHSTVVCGKVVLFPAQVDTLLKSRDNDEVEDEGFEEATILPGEDPIYDLAALPESRASTEINDFGDRDDVEDEGEGSCENSALPSAASSFNDPSALPDSFEPSQPPYRRSSDSDLVSSARQAVHP